jgi:hypothetical protein
LPPAPKTTTPPRTAACNCTTAGPITGNKIDRKDPVISGVSSTPDVLRPVNHKMIDITVGYQPTDLSGVGCSLSVDSNEAGNGRGDGNTLPDWQVLGPHHVQLRAERSGGGNGRIYTITIRCTDGTGKTASATTTVSVPK